MAAGGGVPQFASLYVGDLHADVTEAMLYEIFNSVGPVASIRVCRDSIARRSLGYGYVNFHSVSDAERALDTLNYSSIKGRSCRIMWSQRDPSLRKSGAGNIYVRNLDKNIDNKALYDTFSLFGNILSCKVASDTSGASYGYGFVHYETEEAAKQAIDRVNGMQIGEKTVQVTLFLASRDRVRPEITNYTNLYVKNVPEDWDEAKFNDEFGKYGNITSMAIRADPTGRKMAFINFEESAMAVKCVEEMHMKEIRMPEEIEMAKETGTEEELGPDGHPVGKLFVQRAQTKAERQAELRAKFAGSKISTKETKHQGVNLFVKNLDENTTETTLRELFEPFGEITSVFTPNDDKGKCKGFGFVCFKSSDEATKAVTEMHLKVVKGKPLYVGLAEKKEARQDRLKQRYQPGGGDMTGGFKGGKVGGKGGPMGGNGGPMGGMMGGKMGGMGGMMGGMGGMGGPMGGMGGMGNPQMGGMGGMNQMGMAGKGGPMMGMMPQNMMGMMNPQHAMMQKGMIGPNPQMMGMMGKDGPNPQMMGMMGKGGPDPQMMGMMSMMGKGGPGMMPAGKGMLGMMGMPGPMGMMGKGGPGMMPGGMGMPQMQMGMRPPAQQMPQMPQAQAQAPAGPGAPLNASALAAAPPSVQKQMIGEKLFPAIARYQPELAGKITGMMLEMDNSELLILLESEQQLRSKVDEAMTVLQPAK